MQMDREQAREYMVARSTAYLKPDKSGKGFICPICGSGSGKNGTGITSKDNNRHFTCWAGCFTSADIIDIIGLVNGLTDYNSKLQKAASEYGIVIESGHRTVTPNEGFAPKATEYRKQSENGQVTQENIRNASHTTPQQEENEPDYTDFFLQAHRHIAETDYPQRRGLSKAVIDRFKLGYDANYTKGTGGKIWEACIIPTGKHSYVARNTDPDASKGDRYRKTGASQIFNRKALQEATQPVFIVEGEIDAMSFYEVGAEAVGLGSISNAKKLVDLLEKKKPSKPLIIALDNDPDPDTRARVEKAVGELTEGLERLRIPFYRLSPYGKYKDANEALQADRGAFAAAIREAIEQAETEEKETLDQEKEQLKREAVAFSLQSFIKDIEESKKASFIPTGFPDLDHILDGGLYAGLYIVGAISSLGKTTFCLQIADQVAQAGQDVLVFSLEMARNELIAKSISRLTYIGDIAQYKTHTHAKTTRGILTGSRYANYSQTERELIEASITAYARYAKNIYITEGIGNVGVKEIRDKVEKHIKLTGKAPVVVIDYLQILAPADIRATDKQNTDKAVLELKRLSRDYSIPVIGISSFNRDNYNAPVNLASYKESGAIEYSSDLLLGLQYEGMDYKEGETDKQRESRIRKLIEEAVEAGKKGEAQKIQIKILKNRNGSKGSTILDFYPMFNYFTQEAKREGANNDTDWVTIASSY